MEGAEAAVSGAMRLTEPREFKMKVTDMALFGLTGVNLDFLYSEGDQQLDITASATIPPALPLQFSGRFTQVAIRLAAGLQPDTTWTPLPVLTPVITELNGSGSGRRVRSPWP